MLIKTTYRHFFRKAVTLLGGLLCFRIVALIILSMIASGCKSEPEPEHNDEEIFFITLKDYVDFCVFNHAEMHEGVGLREVTADSIYRYVIENSTLVDGIYIAPPTLFYTFDEISIFFTQNKSIEAQNHVKQAHMKCIEANIIRHYKNNESSSGFNPSQKISTLNSDLIFKFENIERPNRVTGIDHEAFHNLEIN